MDASQAVECGRVHDQLYPVLVGADNILPALVLDDLRDRGHKVKGAFDANVDVDASRPCPCLFFLLR